MKLLVVLAAGASAFSFGGKKAASSPSRSGPTSGAATPQQFKPAFGQPGVIAQRAAERAAKDEAAKAALIPTPARFLFAFGRPDVLQARQQERLAKWEWSSEFLSKARPDQGNYGAGDYFDDGLTVLERNQIGAGKEAYLTGAAKLRYKRLTGQI